MDMIKLARDLRLATVQNLFDQGLLTEEDAREILSGPLDPDDETTVYDDSGLLRSGPTHVAADAEHEQTTGDDQPAPLNSDC